MKNVRVNLNYWSSGFPESLVVQKPPQPAKGLSIMQKVCVPRQACSTA